MQDADKDNINSVAEWLLEEFGCDSTWFAAAWADIYRRMQELEIESRKSDVGGD